MTTTLEITGKSKENFYNMFGSMCDVISIENTVAGHDYINYLGTIDKDVFSQTNDTVSPLQAKICSAPFMRMVIYNNGDVKICGLYDSENEELIENFLNTPITEVWNGEKRRELLIELLRKQFCGIAKSCEHCRARSRMTLKEDWLDPYAEDILKRIFNK